MNKKTFKYFIVMILFGNIHCYGGVDPIDLEKSQKQLLISQRDDLIDKVLSKEIAVATICETKFNFANVQYSHIAIAFEISISGKIKQFLLQLGGDGYIDPEDQSESGKPTLESGEVVLEKVYRGFYDPLEDKKKSHYKHPLYSREYTIELGYDRALDVLKKERDTKYKYKFVPKGNSWFGKSENDSIPENNCVSYVGAVLDKLMNTNYYSEKRFYKGCSFAYKYSLEYQLKHGEFNQSRVQKFYDKSDFNDIYQKAFDDSNINHMEYAAENGHEKARNFLFSNSVNQINENKFREASQKNNDFDYNSFKKYRELYDEKFNNSQKREQKNIYWYSYKTDFSESILAGLRSIDGRHQREECDLKFEKFQWNYSEENNDCCQKKNY
ncbi:hypothetical protein [Cysteiniphilum litorale]|uniref:hypothetical protein n=1 Tax=Cysteiniphilum litorale TaxID=2056700 RepID=UPI003F8806FF